MFPSALGKRITRKGELRAHRRERITQTGYARAIRKRSVFDP